MTGAVRAVLFDAAGTLIETAEPVGETYARLAARHGVDLPARRLGEAFTRILARAPSRVFPEASRAEIPALERSWWRDVARSVVLATDDSARFDDFEAFFGELFDHFAKSSAWRARPGAVEALDALRERGLRVGVVSNFDVRLEPILAGLGLLERLDTLVLPIDAGAEKPDPVIFAVALARLETPAEHAFYVGDDPERNIGAARAAGLRAIDSGGLATLAELPGRIEAFDAVADASAASSARTPGEEDSRE